MSTSRSDEIFILGEMVRIGGEAFATTVTFCNAVKEINRKESSFGLHGGEGISVSLAHMGISNITADRRRLAQTNSSAFVCVGLRLISTTCAQITRQVEASPVPYDTSTFFV